MWRSVGAMRARTCVGLDGVFRGSQAIDAGLVTRSQLRCAGVQRLFHDVYVAAGAEVTHQLRCQGAALVLPENGVITGRSAATVLGVPLAWPDDPVQVVAPPTTRIARRRGFDVRRTAIEPCDWRPWLAGRLASLPRMALDLLLDRPLPDAVADLDVVVRAGLVDLAAVQMMVAARHDKGIVAARRAAQLADPRAESRPESKVRVWLALAGLEPEPQYWIEDSTGRIARTDLAFPARKVAVEYDGGWRDGQLWALNHDRARLNRVQAAGWEVVFVTAPLLRDPDRMVRTVRAALARRR